MNRFFGHILLEILLVLVILAGLFPFLQKQNIQKKDDIEFATLAAEMFVIKNAFETYLLENPLLFENTSSDQVKDVVFKDLFDYGLSESVKEKNKYGFSYSLLARRRVLSSGTPVVDGLILLSMNDRPVLKIRKVAVSLGPLGGYVEDGFIYSSNQSWMDNCKDWDLKSDLTSVVLKIEGLSDSQSYIRRVKTEDSSAQLMMTNLKMGYHDIVDINRLEMVSGDISGGLYSKNISTEGNVISTLEVLNQSKAIDLTLAETFQDCSNEDGNKICPPTLGYVSMTDALSHAYIVGSLLLNNNLTINSSGEAKVSADLFLNGPFHTVSATAHSAFVKELSVKENSFGSPVYSIEAKNLNIDILDIEDLRSPYGLFKSVAFTRSSGILLSSRVSNKFYLELENDDSYKLSLKDLVLKDVNQWIWDNNNEISQDTRPLFKCLTMGLTVANDGFYLAGKGYPVDSGEYFVSNVVLSDVLECFKMLSDAIMCETVCQTQSCDFCP